MTPALWEALALLPQRMASAPARVMLEAIQRQEDPEKRRRQMVLVDGKLVPRGAARGLLQFERGGGVSSVLRTPATREFALLVCDARGVAHNAKAVHEAMEHDDVLCYAFGRLLLWADPAPLPRIGDEAGAFALYQRTWRPGAYTRGTEEQRGKLRTKWQGNYRAAVESVSPQITHDCRNAAP